MKGSLRHRGFTLVEVLLALAILSVLLVLLLSSFTGADRTREILSGRSRAFRQVRITLDRLDSDLRGALSSDAVEATALSCREDRFSGKAASTLSFTAFVTPDPPGGIPATDIVKVRYFPKVSEDGNSIELHREEAALPLVENRIPAREIRIADRLQEFRVELFDGTNWVREWPPASGKKSALPRKVSLVLKDSTGTEFRRVVYLALSGQESFTVMSGRRRAAGQ